MAVNNFGLTPAVFQPYLSRIKVATNSTHAIDPTQFADMALNGAAHVNAILVRIGIDPDSITEALEPTAYRRLRAVAIAAVLPDIVLSVFDMKIAGPIADKLRERSDKMIAQISDVENLGLVTAPAGDAQQVYSNIQHYSVDTSNSAQESRDIFRQREGNGSRNVPLKNRW